MGTGCSDPVQAPSLFEPEGQGHLQFPHSNDRHKYDFDSAGVGCRYWVTDQLGLLQHQGLLVDPEEVTAAKNAIVLLWPDQTPLPLDQGAYYQWGLGYSLEPNSYRGLLSALQSTLKLTSNHLYIPMIASFPAG